MELAGGYPHTYIEVKTPTAKLFLPFPGLIFEIGGLAGSMEPEYRIHLTGVNLPSQMDHLVIEMLDKSELQPYLKEHPNVFAYVKIPNTDIYHLWEHGPK